MNTNNRYFGLKMRLMFVFALLFVLTNISCQSLSFAIDNIGESDSLIIKIYCDKESRISLSEHISITKDDAKYQAHIKSNFVSNIDTSFTLTNQQIDIIRNYQLSVFNGDIQRNFSTLHRLALIHKIKNSDLTIIRQTYAGQEYSLAYSLTRIE